MNLTFLKYFYDVGREKSVVKAAGLNFVSAPAISNGIKKLESELEVELLKHGRNKIELSKEGIQLLKNCDDIFFLLEKTKKNLKFKAPLEHQLINFGITNGLNQEFLPQFLKTFQKKFPSYKVQFKVGTPNQIKTWIQEKVIDFGLTISRDQPKNYQSILLHQGKFKFIIQKSLEKEKMKLPFILTSNWPEVEDFKKEYFKKYKKTPDVSFEVESWDTISKFVEVGLGIGLVPDYHLLKEKKSIKVFPFPIELNDYYIMALFEKGSYLSESSFILTHEFKKMLKSS